MLINSDNSDISIVSVSNQLSTIPLTIEVTSIVVVSQTIENPDILNKLYISCVRSDSTRVVRWNRNMTAIFNKLEEIYTNL